MDVVSIAALGIAGCVLSYDALRQMGTAIHIRPNLTYLFPIVIDGFIAYGVRALVLLRTAPLRARLYTWSLFSGATTASIWANALHAVRLNQEDGKLPGLHLGNITVGVLSTLAPLALAGATHLYILVSRYSGQPEPRPSADADESSSKRGRWSRLLRSRGKAVAAAHRAVEARAAVRDLDAAHEVEITLDRAAAHPHPAVGNEAAISLAKGSPVPGRSGTEPVPTSVVGPAPTSGTGTGTVPTSTGTGTVAGPASTSGTGTATAPTSTGTGTVAGPASTSGTGTGTEPTSTGPGTGTGPASTSDTGTASAPTSTGTGTGTATVPTSTGTGTVAGPASTSGTGTGTEPTSTGTGTVAGPASTSDTGTASAPTSTGTGT
ncbi:DUF2637 domain-containing protein, partial [Streptacidiphilus sp. BW17]|uniref:DUF2637 domain-containing protein n=1 Tax=Streptacidiphilus sp. BW17 TaxID=3156274 RepID=UPI00351854F3